MLDISLQQKKELQEPLQSQINSLVLDFTIETNLDVYDFKVPYPLSILLSETVEPLEEKQIDALIITPKIISEKFSLESYEENLNKFAKFFESNRVHKSLMGKYFCVHTKDVLVCVFKVDKKMDSDVEVTLFSLDKNYKELCRQMICFLINLI